MPIIIEFLAIEIAPRHAWTRLTQPPVVSCSSDNCSPLFYDLLPSQHVIVRLSSPELAYALGVNAHESGDGSYLGT